ncbi:MAG: hypothetical protein HYV63_21040 [Candidatus Schekmanbacteria bacterium]|nr:hypothetical protein [Candidatus Schekmanbacteria bacterium]
MSEKDERQQGVAVVPESRLQEQLAGALRRRSGRATVSDLTVDTGLPSFQVEPVLRNMLPLYWGHLEVTETGELVYAFPPSLTRPDEELGARLSRAGRQLAKWAYRVFQAIFKVCIAGVVIGYFLAFVAILLAVVVALLFRSKGDDDSFEIPSGGGHHHGGGLLDALRIWWLYDWFFYSSRSYREPRYRRRPSRHRSMRGRSGLDFEIDDAPAPERRKGILQSFYDFVFGPPRERADAAAERREVLAYIRAHRGRITASDLVSLKGVPFSEAERLAVQLMIDYDGDVDVSEDGHLVYAFKKLRLTASGAEPAGSVVESGRSWLRFWERPEPALPITGNSTGRNVVIGVLNAFNVFGAIFLSGLLQDPELALFGGAFLTMSPATVNWIFYYIPLAYSTVFLAVPAIRSFSVQRENAQRETRNRLRSVLEAVFGRSGQPAAPAALPGGVDPKTDRDLEQIVLPYGGDVVVDERTGDISLAFPRIAGELGAVSEARAAASADEADPGAIIFK